MTETAATLSSAVVAVVAASFELISSTNPTGTGLNTSSSVTGGLPGNYATPKSGNTSTRGSTALSGGGSGGSGGVGGIGGASNALSELPAATAGTAGYWLTIVVPAPENIGG